MKEKINVGMIGLGTVAFYGTTPSQSGSVLEFRLK